MVRSIWLGRSIAQLALVALLTIPEVARSQVQQQSLWITNGSVSAIAPSAGTIYLGGNFTEVGPAVGSAVAIDTGTGVVAQPYLMVLGSVNAVAPDGSGGWYIGGLFTSVRGQPRNNLAHLDASGTLTSWDPNSNGQVFALIVSGGTVYVGGTFTSVGGQTRNNVAALDGSTAAATAWDPNADNTVRAIALDGFGTVYVGGDFKTIGGQARSYIAAVDPTAGLATGWNPGANYSVSVLGVRTLPQLPFTITVYAGGRFTSIGGQPRSWLAALDGASGAATSWNPNPDGGVNAMAFVAGLHGVLTIYVGGQFANIGAQPRQNIAALDASGAATAWNPGADDFVSALGFSGSTVYAGGNFGTIGGQTRHAIAALDATTGLATSWDPHASQQVNALAVSGTSVFVGGYFSSVGGLTRHYIAALDSVSGAATSWDPNANGSVSAIAVNAGIVYAGGSFSSIGGQPRAAIAALDAATGTATSWNPSPDGDVVSLATTTLNHLPFTLTIYASGFFANIGGQARNFVAAIDGATGAATSWVPAITADGVGSLWASGGTVYVSSYYLDKFSQVILNLTAIDAMGNPIWTDTPNGGVLALAVSGATVYAGGNFTAIGNQVRGYLAALDGTTGLASGWNANASFAGNVNALAVSGGTLYAGGAFTNIGGQARNYLAALDATTAAAASWNPGPDGAINTLAVDGNTIYVAGAFSSILGSWHPQIAAITQGALNATGPSAGPFQSQLRVAPNPFQVQTALHFTLPASQAVDVGVFDLAGRLVRRLRSGMLPSGEQRVVWDGRNDAGGLVGAGMYVVQVRENGTSQRIKLVRLR